MITYIHVHTYMYMYIGTITDVCKGKGTEYVIEIMKLRPDNSSKSEVLFLAFSIISQCLTPLD